MVLGNTNVFTSAVVERKSTVVVEVGMYSSVAAVAPSALTVNEGLSVNCFQKGSALYCANRFLRTYTVMCCLALSVATVPSSKAMVLVPWSILDEGIISSQSSVIVFNAGFNPKARLPMVFTLAGITMLVKFALPS